MRGKIIEKVLVSSSIGVLIISLCFYTTVAMAGRKKLLRELGTLPVSTGNYIIKTSDDSETIQQDNLATDLGVIALHSIENRVCTTAVMQVEYPVDDNYDINAVESIGGEIGKHNGKITRVVSMTYSSDNKSNVLLYNATTFGKSTSAYYDGKYCLVAEEGQKYVKTDPPPEILSFRWDDRLGIFFLSSKFSMFMQDMDGKFTFNDVDCEYENTYVESTSTTFDNMRVVVTQKDGELKNADFIGVYTDAKTKKKFAIVTHCIYTYNNDGIPEVKEGDTYKKGE